MSDYLPFDQVKRIGILGAGTIGASWAAYYLAQGYDVSVWDPGEGWRDRYHQLLDDAWPQLTELGLAEGADKGRADLFDDPTLAVQGTDFIQENAPERMEIKRDLYARIDDHIPGHTILSSSTSGLIMSEMQAGFKSAPRFVVGHPFNPPHLIPLVEVVAGKDTDPAAADWAIGFYKHAGKHSIRVNKEVPGHLANRLQAAIWREAVLAVKNGLASVEDVDAAISQGPGLRYALMGQYMIFNLAGGKGGFQAMLDQFGPGMGKWWETMTENPELTPDLVAEMSAGVAEAAGARTIDDLEAERDLRLVALLKMLQDTKSQIKAP